MKILDVPQSGSLAGTTSSRNRFGQYRRTRAIPVNPNSSPQGTQRARLAAAAATWRTLTSAQRAGWNDLANGFTRTNSLGETYNMTGFMCYVSCYNNCSAAGDAVLANAPALVTPAAPLTAVITLTTAVFSIAYTVTPLPAGSRMFTYVSLQRSAGRNFEGDFRLLQVSAAAAASPVNAYAAYVARFGIPVVTNRIFVALRVYGTAFLSGPLITSAVVA
jgi:hypothetical protein